MCCAVKNDRTLRFNNRYLNRLTETSILNRVHLEANLQKTPLWKWHTSDINRRNTVTQVEY